MLPDMAAYMAGVNKPITNKCLRRAEWHDYRSKCIYMLTLMKAEGILAVFILDVLSRNIFAMDCYVFPPVAEGLIKVKFLQ